MRLSLKRWTLGVLISLSLAALAAAAHAATPPSSGKGAKAKGGGKAVSPPLQTAPATTTLLPTRRGPLIDPDGR